MRICDVQKSTTTISTINKPYFNLFIRTSRRNIFKTSSLILQLVSTKKKVVLIKNNKNVNQPSYVVYMKSTKHDWTTIGDKNGNRAGTTSSVLTQKDCSQ